MRSTTMVMALSLLSCCDGGSGPACPVGSEGCECTHGGTCDPPTTCLDGMCVSVEDSTTDGSPDPTSEPDEDSADDVPGESECLVDGDCDDDDPCTTDTCVSEDEQCVHDPVDADGDGYAATSVDGTECVGGTDCDDDHDDVYPGAEPDCTGAVDRNCSGMDDRDEDGDSHENEVCGGDDCDDDDPETFPGSTSFGCWADRNCDGMLDGDEDGDGFQSEACGGGDCDDHDETVNPGVGELLCNGLDDDCNGYLSPTEDADLDGYASEACAAPGAAVDCDETDPDIHPGAATTCDMIDDDCSGSWQDEAGADDDADGYLDSSCGGTDCDDGDASVFPGVTEPCTDGIDHDCDTVADCHDYETCGPTGICEIVFTTVEAGIFVMGSPADEPGHSTIMEPQHTVTLTRAFEMQIVEVTQGQFQSLMGYNPSGFTSCGFKCPVESISWFEAAAYANTVSNLAGLAECFTCTGSGSSVTCEPSAAYATPYDCPGYRLPTEAEWEYAARAGTTGGTYNGTSTLLDCIGPNTVLEPIAWYCANASDTPHPVGTLIPNAWGLLDLFGNVEEWVHDYSAVYPGDETDPWGPATEPSWLAIRSVRGGSWFDQAVHCRAAARGSKPQSGHDTWLGFRLVRTLP